MKINLKEVKKDLTEAQQRALLASLEAFDENKEEHPIVIKARYNSFFSKAGGISSPTRGVLIKKGIAEIQKKKFIDYNGTEHYLEAYVLSELGERIAWALIADEAEGASDFKELENFITKARAQRKQAYQDVVDDWVEIAKDIAPSFKDFVVNNTSLEEKITQTWYSYQVHSDIYAPHEKTIEVSLEFLTKMKDLLDEQNKS